MAPKREVQQLFDRLVNDIHGLLNKGYRRFERAMIVNHMSGPTGPDSVSVRTGQLRRSLQKIGPQVLSRSTTLTTIRVGASLGKNGGLSLLKRARAHEFGATVRPVKGPWLAIPLSRTRAGIARVLGKVKGYWVKSKRGNPVLIDAMKKKPVLVLVREVKLPARLNFRAEWAKAARQMVEDVRAHVQEFARVRLR